LKSILKSQAIKDTASSLGEKRLESKVQDCPKPIFPNPFILLHIDMVITVEENFIALH